MPVLSKQFNNIKDVSVLKGLLYLSFLSYGWRRKLQTGAFLKHSCWNRPRSFLHFGYFGGIYSTLLAVVQLTWCWFWRFFYEVLLLQAVLYALYLTASLNSNQWCDVYCVYLYDRWSYSCKHEQKGRVIALIPGTILVFLC